MIKKLICDRCGREVTEREDIYTILDSCEIWEQAVRARGKEPRGLFPCKEYRHCKGEMVVPRPWIIRVIRSVAGKNRKQTEETDNDENL